MDRQKAFRVLGIEETKEEELIKAAYRSKLPGVNPEEDPEGFRRLREAYEAALYFGKEKKVEDEPMDSRVSEFMACVDRVYRNLAKRLEAEEWERLLEEEIFNDLELAETAKRELFSYLAVHFRLSAKVWKRLSDFFCISENEREFKEFLPVEFVDFILGNALEKEYGFPMEELSGEPEADYDGFIDDFNELLEIAAERDQEEEKTLKRIEEKIEEMKRYKISHPWFTLEQAKYALMKGEKEEAEKLLMTIWHDRGKNSRTAYEGAVILNACGRQEEAKEIFRQFTQREEMDGYVYASLVEMAKFALQEREFEEAKECADRARIYHASDKVMEILQQCNLGIIEKYKAKTDQLTEEEEISLCWAFLQTEREKEGLQYVREKGLLKGESAKSYQVRSLLLLRNEFLEEGIEDTRRWRESLSEGEDRQQARSLEQEGRALWSIWSRKKDQEGEEAEGIGQLEEQIEKLFEEAIRVYPEEKNARLSKALFFREIKQPQKVVQVCEEMIRISPDYFWSYYYAQEAHMELGNAQEVIDYFYQGREVYAKEPKMYERAAQVFSDFRHYEDMNHILMLAGEVDLNSFGLRLRKLEYDRIMASSSQECKEADVFADSLIVELEKELKENPDTEEEELDEILANTYMERVYLHEKNEAEDIRRVYQMERWLLRAVELMDTDWNRYYLGRFYYVWLELNKKADEHLKICESRGAGIGWVYFFLGHIHGYAEETKEQEEGICYLKKAFTYMPENDDILWRIADIYQKRFWEYSQIEDGEKALDYLDEQRQRFGLSDNTYWQYARAYKHLRRWNEALQMIDRGLELHYSAMKLLEKGQILELMGEKREAIRIYQEAMIQQRQESGGENIWVYDRISDVFQRLEEYDEGITFFRGELEKIRTKETKESILYNLKDLYIRKKDWENALKILEELYGYIGLDKYAGDCWKAEGNRIDDLLEFYKESLEPQELLLRVKEAVTLVTGKEAGKLKEDKNTWFSALETIFDTYECYLGDEQKAFFYAKKSLPIAEEFGKDSEKYISALHTMMRSLWRMNKKEEAARYASIYRDALFEKFKNYNHTDKDLEELYIGRVTRKKVKTFRLFMAAFFSSDYQKAKEYLSIFKNSDFCWNCNYTECYEEWMMEGYMALYEGKKEEAMAFFQKANACEGGSYGSAIAEIRRLEEELAVTKKD